MKTSNMPDTKSIDSIIELIKRLRDKHGCPWDRKQTPSSMSIYIIEEAFELLEAIESNNTDHICEELGDVLFQLMFMIMLFEESGNFSLDHICKIVCKKMIRRHPHVFSDQSVKHAEEVITLWDKIKKHESDNYSNSSILNSVPEKIPALMRAYRISDRAARAGFDWDNISDVIKKVEEELDEFKEELNKTDSSKNQSASVEFGDLLFTMVNVARFAHIHPETALTRSIIKFKKRFEYIEKIVSQKGKELESTSKHELEELWEQAKNMETCP